MISGQQIKRIAMGRKASLFVGNQRSGQTASMAVSSASRCYPQLAAAVSRKGLYNDNSASARPWLVATAPRAQDRGGSAHATKAASLLPRGGQRCFQSGSESSVSSAGHILVDALDRHPLKHRDVI